MRYQVVVGNIGTVYDGPSFLDASFHLAAYRLQSQSGRGRAGGETVTLLRDGEILEEYLGTQDIERKE
ncbi:MAG TPA: hypothetical protein VFP43_16890 [Mesorhizobium sp.]|nr:hypothetical protein [Mesorhizobium sp.]